jgi:hypothetical protein
MSRLLFFIIGRIFSFSRKIFAARINFHLYTSPAIFKPAGLHPKFFSAAHVSNAKSVFVPQMVANKFFVAPFDPTVSNFFANVNVLSHSALEEFMSIS